MARFLDLADAHDVGFGGRDVAVQLPSPTPATWGGVAAWNPSNSGSQTGNFYWAGDSWDSNQPANVGNFLTKTGYFSGAITSPNIAQANLEFVKGSGTGGLPTVPISFGSTGAVTEVTKILIEVAGFSGSNELWYKDTTGYHKVFGGSDGTGSEATLTAYGSFFLELRRGSFIRSTENASGAGNFSVFRDRTAKDTIYVGIEDLNLSEADKDYNDMVISEVVPIFCTTGSRFIAIVPAARTYQCFTIL
jgi:hypothetical protein